MTGIVNSASQFTPEIEAMIDRLYAGEVLSDAELEELRAAVATIGASSAQFVAKANAMNRLAKKGAEAPARTASALWDEIVAKLNNGVRDRNRGIGAAAPFQPANAALLRREHRRH